MPGQCTIVMYHYVRELAETRYPNIRGLTVSAFRQQLAYMQRYYTFVTANDLLAACHEGQQLPRNAALLTFDDGYSEHYTNVFPILDSAGIQGCFFPPVCAVREGRVLDVNKLHFILASVNAPQQLQEEVFVELEHLRSDGHALASDEKLYDKLAVQGAFDPPQIIFIKRLLQRELPQALRASIVDRLFRRHVTDNEQAFARELYVSEEQLKMMLRHGMVIGNHGYQHRWMDNLTPDEQRGEVESSLEFLQGIGVGKESWMMCYPYGAHNASLRALCAELDCGLALTTEFDIAQVSADNALTLPRLDTNHLPKDAAAPANKWTQGALKEAA